MWKSICLVGLVLLVTHTLSAQDEGAIVKRERIDLSQGLFVGFGPSFTLGKNIGDYSTGFNVEAGVMKRLNRVFSVGPSLSFVKFKYDPEVTQSNFKNTFVGGPYEDDNGFEYYQGLYFDLTGGDISIISLAANLKVNFIPVKDKSKFSVYGFAKPFIASSKRTEVKGQAVLLENYGDINDADDWGQAVDQFPWTAGNTYVKSTYGFDVSQDMKEEKKITGGIFVGPGVEVFPAGRISGFLQVAIGYTFPITYVSTEEYNSEGNQNNLDTFISSGNIEKYPMLKKGFPSISLQFGGSYNF